MVDEVQAQIARLQEAVAEGGRRLQELLLRAEQLNGAIETARSESRIISDCRSAIVARRNAVAGKIQARTPAPSPSPGN